jgi:hypothetical protein
MSCYHQLTVIFTLIPGDIHIIIRSNYTILYFAGTPK